MTHRKSEVRMKAGMVLNTAQSQLQARERALEEAGDASAERRANMQRQRELRLAREALDGVLSDAKDS